MIKIIKILISNNKHRLVTHELILSAIRTVRDEGWRIFLIKARVKILPIFNPGYEYSYHNWIIRNEPETTELELQTQESLLLKNRPKISIIASVEYSEKTSLKFAIKSAIKQTYDNWELCLVVVGSTKPEDIQAFKLYTQKDPRIKVKFLEKNLGNSGNYNASLSLATGEFVILLDHDDELACFALYEIVKVLNEKPHLDFIYSDEDKIMSNGKRLAPFFKPDWSPDYLLSCMYIGHLAAYRKTLVDKIEGFRSAYDGYHEYDFVLRFIEETKSIYHIPKILYHRRMFRSLVANDVKVKPDARIAGKKALVDYIHRNGILGNIIDGDCPGSYRLRRQIIGSPLVSIIIPSKDKINVLRSCLESILNKTEYPNYEIIVVDNLSTENTTFEYYQTIVTNPRINILHYDKSFNYSDINNFAALRAKGDYLLFLNNDTEVISGEWLSAMLEHSQRNEVGVVGAQLLYHNRTLQHCGVILGLVYFAGHPFLREYNNHQQGGRPSVICNYSAVTGACMMIRKSVFYEVGKFDTDLAITLNDVDLCLKIRKHGYLVIYTPYAQLFHYASLTRGGPEDAEKRLCYQKEHDLMRLKWADVVDRGDPYYNPNLTLKREDFSLKY